MTHRRSPESWFAVGGACALALLVAGLAVAGLIPGGGPAKSDCYAELSVQGIDNPSNRVQGNKQVLITDGESGDSGPCGDFKCTVTVGVCINQTDPNLPACMPPASLDQLKVKGAFNITVPALLSGPQCGGFVTGDIQAKVKRNKDGTVKKAKPGKMKIKIKAKAPKGTKPRTDEDTVTIVCVPRTVACPPSTTSSTTTTTMPPPPTSSFSFTTATGTTNCGPAGLTSAPAAPVSGEIDSDIAGTTKISDLGLGCLYFGGGMATVIPPGRIPDGAASFLAITAPGTLGASPGTGFNSCTQGLNTSSKHCINNNSTPACTTDTDCGGSAGSCGADARCAFGPPLPILSPPPFGALTTCIVNVVANNASGTFDAATGNSSVSLPLVSRVYITTNTASPCPKCAPTCTYGKSPGATCTPVGSLMTSNECLPSLGGFQAPLGVNLTPLTSGTIAKTDAAGNFCPSQTNPGAFGHPTAQRIAETGVQAGNLSDMMPHPSALGSVFCLPATGNPAVDGVSDLPGPGAIGLNGVIQLH